MRRFFVPDGVLGAPKVALEGDLAHRLARVLRMKAGESVILSEGGPTEYEVRLTAVSPKTVAGEVTGEREAPPEPRIELVLYQSLIRANRFDLVLEKGTEIGVSRFVPVVPARGQIQDESASENRMSRWRRIVVEAAEQCGRGRPPRIDPPQPFDAAVRDAAGLRLLPWEGGAGLPSLGGYLRSLEERPDAVSLFIGPEGGFAESEVDLARRASFTLVTLGPRILRSETAGIVAATVVLEALGELG